MLFIIKKCVLIVEPRTLQTSLTTEHTFPRVWITHIHELALWKHNSGLQSTFSKKKKGIFVTRIPSMIIRPTARKFLGISAVDGIMD